MSRSTERQVGEFDPSRQWRLDPQVALRDEQFGALAYHYGTRRLVFLKSRDLVEIVRKLATAPSATDAVAAVVSGEQQATYEAALSRLAISEIISAA